MNGKMSDRSHDMTAARSVQQRLVALDALRGLDMFFIVGMEEVFESISRMVPMTPSLNDRLQHAEWAGFHFYDLIFPLFVFIVGVSLVFSLGKSIEQIGKWATTRKIIRRGIILYLLGIVVYGGISAGVDQVRLLGVLQRIALCFMAAGLAFVWLRTRTLVGMIVGLLVGYWAMMSFIPVPTYGAGDFAEGRNFANWIDQQYLPFRKWNGTHDPEGLLSTLPAIASCLLGVLAGLLLRDPHVDSGKKVRSLLVWGIVLMTIGLMWHLQFPIIKKIWSSSFVLLTAGISAILLGMFYQIVDVWHYRRWCQPFVWIGMNAITIYLVFHFVNLSKLAQCFVGGDVYAFFEKISTGLGHLVAALVTLFFSIVICRFLHQRNIFLRV